MNVFIIVYYRLLHLLPLLSVLTSVEPFERSGVVSIMILKSITKVLPINTPSTPQKNNFFAKGYGTIRQSRFFIIIQAALGINRLNLLNYGGLVKWLGYIYSFLLVGLAITTFVANINEDASGSHAVLKMTSCIEYCLLVFSSMLLLRKKLQSFYYNISKFDAMLNIDKNISITSPIYSCIAWITISLCYFIAEGVLLNIYVPYLKSNSFIPMWYLISLAHDTEQIFYVMLIRFVLMRLKVLKEHITKAFCPKHKESKRDESGKLENLANNTELDTSAMHRAYELLHKCSEELNASMSFPVTDLCYCNPLL